MTVYRKYPRTKHLPWSRSRTCDDKVHRSMDSFVGAHVVVTEKMDGENTTMYPDHIHARSIDSDNHPTRDWVKGIHGQIRHLLSPTMRVCGENLYAKHSIFYENLPSYFLVFNVWDGDICLSWEETLEWCELLELQHVPVLYEGIYDEEIIKALWNPEEQESIEGYVIRHSGRVHRNEFGNKFGKFVRKNHVQTSEHWMHQEIVPNKLDGNQ